jgi:hypothetical protein
VAPRQLWRGSNGNKAVVFIPLSDGGLAGLLQCTIVYSVQSYAWLLHGGAVVKIQRKIPENKWNHLENGLSYTYRYTISGFYENGVYMNDSFIVTIIELETDIVHVEALWEYHAPEAGNVTLKQAAAKMVSQMIEKIGTTDVIINIKFCTA